MDLFESDYITVTGKINAADHIIANYRDFGWTLTERRDDKLYCDVTHMSFTRPHFIENKDELQLMQVRLEIAYNTAGKYSHKTVSRAVSLGNLAGLIAILLTVGGVLLMLSEALLSYIFGPVLCAVGVAEAVVGELIAYRVYKADKKKYSLLIKQESQKIESLCTRARELRGVNE